MGYECNFAMDQSYLNTLVSVTFVFKVLLLFYE
ncbi:hypothetical protein PCC9214_05011 [Planktothrix tepida]|nr:hypothetical protein PCC9214_05011 [Planktothrix tepida]